MTAPSHNDCLTKRPLQLAWTVLAVAVLAACVALLVTYGMASDVRRDGPIEHEVRSDFSHIRIRRQENVRTLLFVNEAGREVVESRVDLDRPDRLTVAYTEYMFASYLFAPEQKRALIVGLGGGGMVHFLKRHDPELMLDVVEIDPVVIQLADEYFHVKSEGNVRVINQDALKLLEASGDPYDVIYMDAFLGESDATDGSGVPLHLKTAAFFKLVQSRLTPDGVVVFNLHQHRDHAEDVAAIRASFGQVYVFDVPSSGNVIAIATMGRTRLSTASLGERAAALDRKLGGSIAFTELLENMTQ
jgi:spermidine synthase